MPYEVINGYIEDIMIPFLLGFSEYFNLVRKKLNCMCILYMILNLLQWR